MRKVFNLTLVCLLAAVATPALFAQQLSDIDAQNARVYKTAAGRSLTAASQAAPAAIVHDFLNFQKRSSSSLGELKVTRENQVASSGLTHLRIEQEVAGLSVFGSYAKAALNSQGELVHLIENLASAPVQGVQPALVGPGEALSAALARVHPAYKALILESDSWGNTVAYAKGSRFFRDPTVTRVAVPMRDGSMHEGYLVETWTGADNLLHHTLVDGSGRVRNVQLRTNTDSYNIFPDHPGNSNQTVTAGAGNGNTESPGGWLSGSQTTVSIRGNNVHAYLDTDANNSPDGGGSAVTNGDFLTNANLNQEPETGQNQAVAVQNLFYFNNVIHDKLYSHGFTEAAGNFQADDNDEVLAEAQDGSGTNNANFSTPPDGSNGRMQMFVWTQTSPKRDGDVDSDIIWHEYGHGLTWRMIGNMSGAMSGAIGEGMSDVLAILINDDDVVGEYSTNDSNGIRSAPYTNYGRTYGDFSGNSVHFDGEIYAATIWRLWSSSRPIRSLRTRFSTTSSAV